MASDFYKIREIEGFYDEDEPVYKEEYIGMVMNPYCTPSYTESCLEWESWVFGGMTRKRWKDFGGLNESTHWGTVDFDFIIRRRAMKWATNTPKDIYVVHQNHDRPIGKFKPTCRDFKSMLDDSLKKYAQKRNFLKELKL